MIVSETQPPAPQGMVEKFERGFDPWHPDAFKGTCAENSFEAQEQRRSGWLALDFAGNEIAFIADGTEEP